MMLNALLQQLQELGIQKDDQLLLALSGGVDSMVLFNLLLEAKQKFAVAHVNFSLRGEDSIADEAFLKRQSKDHNIVAHFKTVDTQKYADEHKSSIQLAAREIRYRWFEELKAEHDYETLITAHHLDDSIETLFINLDRGTGIDGLSGINSSKQLFRPLLNFSKDEIRSYAKSKGIEFREDKSNADIKYKRNWFRHEILQKWKAKNPHFTNTMRTTLANLKESQEIVNHALETDLNQLESLFNQGSIPFEVIHALPHQNITLYKFFHAKGFSQDQIRKMYGSIVENKSGKSFDSPLYQILIDRSDLIIREKSLSKSNKASYSISKSTKAIVEPIPLTFEKIDRKDCRFDSSKNIELFDYDKIRFPLELRLWKNGDKMKPLGMLGEKKLSDILIDEKVSLFEKENCWVLCSADQIIWLIGKKTSELFKIDEHTTSVLKIEWEKQ